MHLSTWLVFLGVALVLTFTPGPGVLMALSNGVSMGPRRAMLGSLGNALGVFLVSGVSMAGLGVVLATSATAFLVLKFAGAAYLIYLGVRQWRSKTDAFATAAAPEAGADAPRDGWRLFGHGIAVALTNPKSILFFSALFPQFIAPDAPVLEQFFVLTGTVVVCSLISHAFYMAVARGMQCGVSNARRARWFNRVSGGLFVVLGLSLLRLRSNTA